MSSLATCRTTPYRAAANRLENEQYGTSAGGPPSHNARRQPRLRAPSNAGSTRLRGLFLAENIGRPKRAEVDRPVLSTCPLAGVPFPRCWEPGCPRLIFVRSLGSDRERSAVALRPEGHSVSATVTKVSAIAMASLRDGPAIEM